MSGYGIFAQYYDAFTDNVDYPARARVFDALSQQYAGQRGLLLDLACGTGSLSVELSKLGYEVIGVDASADMLAVAAGKAAMAGQHILFLQQDMAALDLYGTVDIVICALDSLNHLPSEAALHQTMQKVSLFLNPGGLFLFDLNTRYKHREILQNNVFVYEREDVFCVWQNALDPADDHVDITLDFFARQSGGQYRRFTEQFTERVFSDAAVERSLTSSNFFVRGWYGWDGSNLPQHPPTGTTQRILCVAQKNKQDGEG